MEKLKMKLVELPGEIEAKKKKIFALGYKIHEMRSGLDRMEMDHTRTVSDETETVEGKDGPVQKKKYTNDKIRAAVLAGRLRDDKEFQTLSLKLDEKKKALDECSAEYEGLVWSMKASLKLIDLIIVGVKE